MHAVAIPEKRPAASELVVPSGSQRLTSANTANMTNMDKRFVNMCLSAFDAIGTGTTEPFVC